MGSALLTVPTSAAPRVGVCSAGIGIGLTEIPAATQKDPRAQLYIVDTVKPGSTFHRTFQVCNGTSKTQTIAVYPGPAVIHGGRFDIVDGRQTSELTSWITVTPTSFTIPSGENRIAQATFSVPRAATGGERYGVLLAELPPTPGPRGIQVASRVGIRVYLDVSGKGDVPSDFTVASLQASRLTDGTPQVTAQIHNTGQRALDMRGSLKLTDGPGGTSAGPFLAQLGATLKPGELEPVTVRLPKDLPAGPWKATMTATSGLLERRAEAEITFPTQAGTSAQPVKARQLALYKDKAVVVPIAVVLIGLLLLILLLLVVRELLKRRRQRD